MILFIDRATWNTGRTKGPSGLLLKDGTKCCLGFLAKACGADDSEILNGGSPGSVDAPLPWPDGILGDYDNYGNTRHTCRLMEANDTCVLSDVEREVAISRGMAEIGISVIYTGEYPK